MRCRFLDRLGPPTAEPRALVDRATRLTLGVARLKRTEDTRGLSPDEQRALDVGEQRLAEVAQRLGTVRRSRRETQPMGVHQQQQGAD